MKTTQRNYMHTLFIARLWGFNVILDFSTSHELGKQKWCPYTHQFLVQTFTLPTKREPLFTSLESLRRIRI